MLFKQAARGDERIYATYQNVEASSLTTGYAVALALGTAGASFSGTQACLAGTAAVGRQTGWIGIAAADIAPNAYGLVQVYGPIASVFVSNVGTSITINVGDACVPAALSGSVFSAAAPTWAISGFGVIIASNTLPAVSATGWMSGFMKHGL
jgi:hypothetical protein